jgi:hypothetical protein
MRRPRADREDDPASGKRSTDARKSRLTGQIKPILVPAQPSQPGEAPAFEKLLANGAAIRRPHYLSSHKVAGVKAANEKVGRAYAICRGAMATV